MNLKEKTSTELINKISAGIRKACFDDGQMANLFEICVAFSSVLAATIIANELAYTGRSEAELIEMAADVIRATATELCHMRREEKDANAT